MLARMRSMTGFGRGCADAVDAGVRIQIEINSVNRKTLDVQISAPREWNGYESICNEWISAAFQRGRVNVQIKVESTQGGSDSLALNTNAMAESLKGLRAFAESQDLEFTPDSGFLLELARSVKDSSGLPDWKELKDSIQEAFQKALADIDSMRQQEGAALAADLKERITQLEDFRQQIEKNASGSTLRYRDALLERLKQLKLELDPSDERVLKEVAIFADRSDISEETTRLACHFEQFLSFLNADEATGRKMDFLCQEIHREFNTTGSKSNDIEITRMVIEGKNALERIREQVQNIE
ncbi:YicC/YloC family endoribonuclease [Coraliomargarita algicola]|uniref:YicC/YloC family endoribonuclease n=1 Tax=Coraliomargarita algicola TaxID=3092156 RepID=A0ABZ0RFX7_9BACT|nr:YicC/YloC family endoribonuclease [Coraliomargarita sp. J2-16]WPJ95070.1 YicC/YloC family endoribonuclease [Coraliomargarita sp. J2-16]